VRITILNGLGVLGKIVSRFTTIIAKFLQISLAFVRTVLQTMTPLPAKQANLKKKLVSIYFSRKPKEKVTAPATPGELRCVAACCGGGAPGLRASGRRRRPSGRGAVGRWALGQWRGGRWVLSMSCCGCWVWVAVAPRQRLI
jgi:hypothetical protein